MKNSCKNEKETADSDFDSNAGNQFGINLFNKKNKTENDGKTFSNDKKKCKNQESLPVHIGNFISRKEKLFIKKPPNSLEKTLNNLNADEESNSDSESITW